MSRGGEKHARLRVHRVRDELLIIRFRTVLSFLY